MDNLTHGLLGLAIGAVRRPEGDARAGRRLSATDRAVLVASTLAAELPDLDGLWPMPNAILGAVEVHRGISHSLLFTPIWALAATGVARLLFRGARAGPPFVFAWFAVLFAHLATDAWTGWGTRLLLPFSDLRLSWDWTMVLDPLFTAPLLLAAIAALIWRARWRPVVLAGLLISTTYLGARVAAKQHLDSTVARQHPDAEHIAVFPDWFGLTEWRYVATYPERYIAGTVALGEAPRVRATHARGSALPDRMMQVPTVREAVSWARFPIVTQTRRASGGDEIRVSDLRYHLKGEPTLSMEIELDDALEVKRADMVRPTDPRKLLDRWRDD
ncbi:MAG: metal-dependent hydrolase [Myxococcaceae bacterium]